jgi:DNA-binding protein H-NS
VATYRELKAQLAELESQAAAVRRQEYDAVLADIRAKVVEFGYTESRFLEVAAVDRGFREARQPRNIAIPRPAPPGPAGGVHQTGSGT